MSISLRQAGITAKLSQVEYHQPEGFQEDNTWYVSEETLTADSDTQLASGPATLMYDGKTYQVAVTVLEFEPIPGQEDEGPEPGEPVCSIEISTPGSLPKLALALGLLDHLTSKQQRALAGS
jgi:hypothetical protein